jgi:L-ribulose-5-phosphate 4-epimerase
MLDKLKQEVLDANLRLVEEGLVVMTWGNASAVERESGNVVIKPSGVMYGDLTPEDMVVVSLEDGKKVEGEANPSTDTPTHLELYRSFGDIGGVVHTHSLYASAWAQARRELPAYGTTHADTFYGTIPCTRPMIPEEIESDYELNTGRVIVERFENLDYKQIPGVFVVEHGPFTWGTDVKEAVENAIILEHLSRLATETLRVEPYPRLMQKELLDKHFLRKHGPGAYYGQGDS